MESERSTRRCSGQGHISARWTTRRRKSFWTSFVGTFTKSWLCTNMMGSFITIWVSGLTWRNCCSTTIFIARNGSFHRSLELIMIMDALYVSKDVGNLQNAHSDESKRHPVLYGNFFNPYIHIFFLSDFACEWKVSFFLPIILNYFWFHFKNCKKTKRSRKKSNDKRAGKSAKKAKISGWLVRFSWFGGEQPPLINIDL